MRLFRKRNTRSEDPLDGRASSLIEAAKIQATTSYVPLLDRFAAIRQVDVEKWDFILTVAGVFVAATRLNNLQLSQTRQDAIMDMVAGSLANWAPDSINTFEDCSHFFEIEYDRLSAANHEPRFVGSDALGKWVVWNVLGRAPVSQEELELVRVIGSYITHAFFDWWDG